MKIKSIYKRIVIHFMKKSGYSNYFAFQVFQERFDDIFKNKNTSLRQKIWAQRRGFLSDKISFYSLNENNYKNYLSDFDYKKLHPINGEFSKWIDDKLTTKLILHPFSEYLPEYYFHVVNGEILRLFDLPESFKTSINDILEFLKNKNYVAAKKQSGSSGIGFYKLGYESNNYFINNVLCSENEMINLIKQWLKIKVGGYLITEYLTPHSNLRKIWDKTPNTLRLTIGRLPNQAPKIIGLYTRFGTSKTGVIDNASSGGVFCKVNLENGFFYDAKLIENKKIIDCKYHPDSNILIEGFFPNWAPLIQKVIDICSFIQQIKYMGVDVIITDSGFKIIEINSHPSIEFFQYDTPIFNNQTSKNFYLNLMQNN